jgi:protein-disulfide isomerase
MSVPTIFVNETRFVGVPKWDDLLEAVSREKLSTDLEADKRM